LIERAVDNIDPVSDAIDTAIAATAVSLATTLANKLQLKDTLRRERDLVYNNFSLYREKIECKLYPIPIENINSSIVFMVSDNDDDNNDNPEKPFDKGKGKAIDIVEEKYESSEGEAMEIDSSESSGGSVIEDKEGNDSKPKTWQEKGKWTATEDSGQEESSSSKKRKAPEDFDLDYSSSSSSDRSKSYEVDPSLLEEDKKLLAELDAKDNASYVRDEFDNNDPYDDAYNKNKRLKTILHNEFQTLVTTKGGVTGENQEKIFSHQRAMEHLNKHGITIEENKELERAAEISYYENGGGSSSPESSEGSPENYEGSPESSGYSGESSWYLGESSESRGESSRYLGESSEYPAESSKDAEKRYFENIDRVNESALAEGIKQSRMQHEQEEALRKEQEEALKKEQEEASQKEFEGLSHDGKLNLNDGRSLPMLPDFWGNIKRFTEGLSKEETKKSESLGNTSESSTSVPTDSSVLTDSSRPTDSSSSGEGPIDSSGEGPTDSSSSGPTDSSSSGPTDSSGSVPTDNSRVSLDGSGFTFLDLIGTSPTGFITKILIRIFDVFTASTPINESVSPERKQTPTEYVAELETLELPSYIWEEGD
jgi:hypothetical protein